MRLTPTAAESMLWAEVRNRKIGAKFRRQQAIGRFVADFCSVEAKLVVEVDGPIHRQQRRSDAERDAHLGGLGFQVLRFSNEQVENDLTAVVRAIKHALKSRTGGRVQG